MAECQECVTASGNECILYDGDPCVECGLTTDTWYMVDTLISLLQCANSNCASITSSTTSSTTTSVSTINVADATGTGATFLFMPGNYVNSPGSGSTLQIPNGNYYVFITNTPISGKSLRATDTFGGGGNTVFDNPVGYTQQVTIPEVLSLIVHT